MKHINLMAAAASLLAMTSCLGGGDETIVLGSGPADIPADIYAEPNPVLPGDPTVELPDVNPAVVDEKGSAVIRVDIPGVRDRRTLEWVRFYGTDDPQQNVWVEIDDQPKALTVKNSIDEDSRYVRPVDMVFLVDNASTMSEESDAIVSQITAWAETLDAGNLDMRFGCVGYDGAITGAYNITTVSELSGYLHRPAHTGTLSTFGFEGKEADINRFRANLPSYDSGEGNVSAMAALRFADDLFDFRQEANRIYVNFTDRPNYPYGNKKFSVESLLTDWSVRRGVIHTVYSGKSDTGSEPNYLMSDYTDGTVMNVDPSFAGVSISTLPVSGSVENSGTLRLSNIGKYIDGKPHRMHVTLLSPDKTIRAERYYTIQFNVPQ